jgi:hypothetical protein
MRSYAINGILCLLLLAVSLTGCRVVGGIFKAGMWIGIIGLVLVIAWSSGSSGRSPNRVLAAAHYVATPYQSSRTTPPKLFLIRQVVEQALQVLVNG